MITACTAFLILVAAFNLARQCDAEVKAGLNMQSLPHNENYLVASDVELFSKVPDSEYASLADTHTSFTNTRASIAC